MQKALIIGLSLVVMLSYTINCAFAYTPQESKKIINGAIAKYKAKNYVGCISDLKIYTTNDDKNAVAWYYLGNAYMRIAMKDDAMQAFDRAIALDTVPQVTAYSVQAKMCMEDPTSCKYQLFSKDDIAKLRLDPKKFFDELAIPKVEVEEPTIQNPYYEEINKLISNKYTAGVHNDARRVLEQEKMRAEQARVNGVQFENQQ